MSDALFQFGFRLPVSRLSIRAGTDDQSMQPFEPITTAAKLPREVFEQLGMTRSSAVEAKIVGRIDDARAEMIMPDAVDDHACEERIVFTCDPLCQLLTTLRLRCIRG